MSSKPSPAAIGVLVEEGARALEQPGDDVGTDGVIEHRRGADLHRAAAEQEVVQGVAEIRDAADAGERSRRGTRASSATSSPATAAG